MSEWTTEELETIGTSDEIQITVIRTDGTSRRPTTVWVVQAADDLYVRSWAGQRSAWIRSALRHLEGRIRAGGIERAVAFELAVDADHDAIDQAYSSKYAQYDSVEAMASPAAREATLRLLPR